MLHKAAQRQVALIRSVYQAVVSDRFRFDYARKIRQLDDLPVLSHTLSTIEKVERGVVIVDDLSRLFRCCEMIKRQDLLGQLEMFGEHVASLRHGARLSNMSSDQKHDLLLYPERRWAVKGVRTLTSSRDERANATELARIASLKSRKNAAAKRDQKIADLRHELIDAGMPSAASDIASEADRRLLRTAHGLSWTARSVRQALARVAETQSSEPA